MSEQTIGVPRRILSGILGLLCLWYLFQYGSCYVGPGSSTSSLVKSLKHGNPGTRTIAARQLGRKGPEAVPMLTEALGDENEDVRKAAIDSLGNIGPEAKRAIPALTESLKDEDADVSMAVIRSLRSVDPEAITPLIEALKVEHGVVRRSAAQALMEMGPKAKDAMPALAEVLKSDPDDDVRCTAALALGSMGPEAIPALTEVLQDTGVRYSRVRVAAVNALGNMGPVAIPALTPVLKNKDVRNWDVRVAAVHAIGNMGPEAIPVLTDVLRSEKDKEFLPRVAYALSSIGPEALPALTDELKNEQTNVRVAAIDAVGNIGPDAILALIDALRDDAPIVRRRAVASLNQMGNEATLATPALNDVLKEALTDALSDEDESVRRTAMVVLKKVFPEAVPTPRLTAGKPIRFAWFVDFSPDGNLLVTSYGGWDSDEKGEVYVWNIETGRPRFVIPSDRGVRAVVWSPKGTFFASGNYGGLARLYDSKTGKTMLDLSTVDTPTKGGSIEVLQITPDERWIIGGTGNGKILIWERMTGKLMRTISGHYGDIWGMRLAEDGVTLASAGKDQAVRVWNIESGKRLYEFDHPEATNGVAFTSDRRLLATGCWDGQIRFWDLETGKLVRTLQGHRSAVNDFDFARHDKLLASSGNDGTVRLWDHESEDMLATLQGHQQVVFGTRFSPSGKIVASGSWDGTIKVWDVDAKKELMTLVRQPRAID